MTPAAWMVGVGLVSWLVVIAAAGPAVHPEALFGLLGPLASAAATAVLTERTHRTAPERVTRVMVAALGAKFVFFGAYVVVMLEVLALRPVPFAVSFTGYFVLLYGMEALFLQRLLRGDARPAR
jgi:hypothetical protein